MPRPVIIDTDPGQDDALAILLALASPELEVVGITAVAGNVPLDLTAANARRVCELAGRPDVPVFGGCARPMLRLLHTAEAVHGTTGLDGADLPPPHMPLQTAHAVDWLVDTLMAAEAGTITLCPLGPLTNIALAIVKQPLIVPKIREIVLMGGAAFTGGNTTPAAEFNIYVDPHAADVVFGCGAPVTMIPLDCTHQALITPDWLGRLRAVDTPVARACAGMLAFYNRFDRERYGFVGAPLHDPCVIARLLAPELFAGKRCRVSIETGSELTMGQTVVDWWGIAGLPPNALVLTEIDAAGFFELVLKRLAGL